MTGSTENEQQLKRARNAKNNAATRKLDASNKSSEMNTGSAANRFTSSSDQRIPDYGSAQLHYSQNLQILQLIALF